MTCRDEILVAIRRLISRTGSELFTIEQVLAEMETAGTRYPEATVRTHIASSMCVNAPPNHATRYGDLERVRRGVYRLYGP
jgi:hypothetical protein